MKRSSLLVCLRSLSAIAGLAVLTAAQAQPTLSSIYPDGTVQFQATNTLAFNVSSTVGITNLTVQLSATNLVGVGTTQLLTNGSGLTVTGPATSETATATLSNNIMYIAVIQAADANGTLSTTVVFDTITPSYTWEAEDYDYTNGLYFDNPQTNAYVGLFATLGVDAYNPNNPSGDAAGNTYRPTEATGAGGNLGIELNADIPRVQYVGSGLQDFDQGWNNGGSANWGNYTRHFPAGRWNIYMRGAGWAVSTESAVMYQGGTNGTLLGEYIVPNTGAGQANIYQHYTWVPLGDAVGNPIEWDTDGTQQTLTIQAIQGNYNANFYMLVPVDTNYHPKPFVSNVYPDGNNLIFPTNTSVFSFVANSTAGLATSNVVLTMNGVVPYGITFSGSPHFYTVSCPIVSNAVYKVNITLTDINGSSSYSTTFGTFSTNNYTWECEDWDYTNGLYFDNPQVGAYAGLYGTPGVDANNTSGGGTAYRANDTGDLGNETTGDPKRAQFVAAGTNDYDIGWTATGQWANYTRHYPAGAYYVFMRGASPGGQKDFASLGVVTSGVGTPSQTVSLVGSFDVPLTGGWQNYTWVPMRDTNGNYAVITNSGSVTTLRMNEDNGGCNANFFMLVPYGTVPFPPVISQLYPDGSMLFQRTNTLSFVVNSAIPISPGNVTVILNGVALNNLVFSGPATSLNVSWPHLQPNTQYSATIIINATNNVTAPPFTYNFDTFSSAYYTWEGEDWDYNGGQFFDNPQTNAYLGQVGLVGIDAINNSGGANAYRPSDSADLGNEITGDPKRIQYIAAAQDDYDIGWTGTGQWANYTRTYPSGVYNVYARAASPGGQADAFSLLRVTSGLGTSNQTTVAMGHFDVPNTGSWQSYVFMPMRDNSGNLVTVTNSGSVSTFRMNEDHGGFNLNFFMLVPAGFKLNVGIAGGMVNISFPTATNATYQIQYKNHLSDPTWTNLGNPVSGTGGYSTVQDPVVAGGTRFYRGMVTGL